MATAELLPSFKSKGNLSLLDEQLTALFCCQPLPRRPHPEDL